MNNDYEKLKAHGHSPAKAAEILLDAKRGDSYSIKWIEIVRSAQERSAATIHG